MVVSAGAIAFLLFSTVSIHVLRAPSASDQLQVSGAPPVASASAVPVPRTSRARRAGGLGQPGQGGFDSGQVTRFSGGSAGSQAPGAGTATAAATGGGASGGTTGTPAVAARPEARRPAAARPAAHGPKRHDRKRHDRRRHDRRQHDRRERTGGTTGTGGSPRQR